MYSSYAQQRRMSRRGSKRGWVNLGLKVASCVAAAMSSSMVDWDLQREELKQLLRRREIRLRCKTKVQQMCQRYYRVLGSPTPD